jgi:hypothetical protein
MKPSYSHLIYLSIIAILGFQNWQQKHNLEAATALLMVCDSTIQVNESVLQRSAIRQFVEVDKIRKAYNTPYNQSFTSKADEINSLSRKYVEWLMVERQKAASDKASSFTPSKIQMFKDSMSKFNQSLLDKTENKAAFKDLEKHLLTTKLLKKDSFWQPFSNEAANYLQLDIFQNAIQHDKLKLMEYIHREVGGCIIIRPDKFLVDLRPKKTVIFEGDTFEGQMLLSAYSSHLHSGVELFVNDKPVPIINGEAFVNFPNQSVGTKTLNLVGGIRNPLTGQLETSTYQFEYEVLPKCSRDCR